MLSCRAIAELDLTSIEGLLAAVAAWDKEFVRTNTVGGQTISLPMGPLAGDYVGNFRGTYCTRCGDLRRMDLQAADDRCAHLNPRKLAREVKNLAELDAKFDPLSFSIGAIPPVFVATCRECNSTMALVVDAGPPPAVVVLGGKASGFATRHTPPSVAYYLDQAYRARTRAAFTAAVVMYGAALEQLLAAQGFDGRRLADQIDAAVDANPPWITHLDHELMDALRSFRNRAAHGSVADAVAEAERDRQLTRDIEFLFVSVLDEIYEAPARREAMRTRFRDARGGQG